MTRDDILTMVLSRLGRREGDAYLLAQAKLELNRIITDDLESAPFMPWFLLSGELTFVSTPNVRSVALPGDFLKQWDDYPLYVYDTTQTDPYVELIKDEFNYLKARFSGQGAATPSMYSLDGNQLDFFVTPDKAYTFKWRYYQRSAALSDSSLTNVWTQNAPTLLLGELGTVMAGAYKRDDKAMKFFMDQRQRAYTGLLAYDEARKQAQRDAQMGDIH